MIKRKLRFQLIESDGSVVTVESEALVLGDVLYSVASFLRAAGYDIPFGHDLQAVSPQDVVVEHEEYMALLEIAEQAPEESIEQALSNLERDRRTPLLEGEVEDERLAVISNVRDGSKDN